MSDEPLIVERATREWQYLDARHYLHATRQRFDMIVFGTLDSQALLSG